MSLGLLKGTKSIAMCKHGAWEARADFFRRIFLSWKRMKVEGWMTHLEEEM